MKTAYFVNSKCWKFLFAVCSTVVGEAVLLARVSGALTDVGEDGTQTADKI